MKYRRRGSFPVQFCSVLLNHAMFCSPFFTANHIKNFKMLLARLEYNRGSTYPLSHTEVCLITQLRKM